MTDSRYSMNNDQVRRQLFWLLQRLSSHSLWQRKRDAWAYFAEKYEEALKTWPESKTRKFDPDTIIYIYDALYLYELGLEKLAQGNRQAWRTEGEFSQAFRQADLTRSTFYPWYHERGAQGSAYPPDVDALNQLRLAAKYGGDNVIFPPTNGSNVNNATALLHPRNYVWAFGACSYPVFPDLLPPVPPGEDCFVLSHDKIPCDGIWEPVETEHNYLTGETLINQGAFNYFISGISAPERVYYDSNVNRKLKKVRWHLIWKDTRYLDGIIPDESEYFLPEPPDRWLTCQTGKPCPYAGRWYASAAGYQQFIQATAGQIMPKGKRSYIYDEEDYPETFPVTWILLERDDKGSVFRADIEREKQM